MMPNKTAISVIVPVYNVEKYLDKCVESISNQTYTCLDIVLVDDGSTDESSKKCDEWKEKDKRIRVLHKQNGGLSDAKNAGLDIVTGKYVCFVDSDDYLLQNAIQEMYAAAEVQANCCVVMNALLVWGKKQTIQKSGQYGLISAENGVCGLFTGKIKNYSPAKLYPTKAWAGIRFPSGKTFEDISTTFEVFQKCNYINIIEYAGYCYVQRKGSITDRAIVTRLDAIEAYKKQLSVARIRYTKTVKYLEYRVQETTARYIILKHYLEYDNYKVSADLIEFRKWIIQNMFSIIVGKFEPEHPIRCQALLSALIYPPIYAKVYLRYVQFKLNNKAN